jgi:hypothetical protein
MIWATQDAITDVLPAWRGTPHFSRHVTECLNEQFTDRWIGRGGAQNWSLPSPDLTPYISMKKKHGGWTQSKQKTGTFYLNFKFCKTHESWISNIRRPTTVENRTHVCVTFLTRNDLRNTMNPVNTFLSIFLRSVLILSSHLRLRLVSSLQVSQQNFLRISYITHTRYMPHQFLYYYYYYYSIQVEKLQVF